MSQTNLKSQMEVLTKQMWELCQKASRPEDVHKELVELALKISSVPAAPARSPASNMKVAVLGLGAMGKGIAHCLEQQHYRVSKWNRSDVPEKNCSTIQEAVRDADVVFSMLADDTAVASVATEICVHLKPGATHVSLSTISVKLAKKLEQDHLNKNQHFVSCPVFGRPVSRQKKRFFFCL
jgi:prephenate dehydrogenase